MSSTPRIVAGLVGASIAWLTPTASAQSFVNAPSQIPQGNPLNSSSTENVDFGDIDNDGDFDAIFADGGDNDQDQNRIWVNQGYAQPGPLGTFVDVTSTQAPAINDQSRDIEFADIDNDDDLDIYVSNTSQIFNQTNRWWTNMGGLQGGTAGFYSDETATRWIGLGGAGSSIAPSQVLGMGGFIDYSCDCDFGDLDNDGDLDLVHSTYGGAFGGQVPTRIFLNDGSGNFSEFNPSGFQLPGQGINNGNPGIWCAGMQSANTTNSTGASCDIASTPLDIQVGDIDGDLDLDILHGARVELPRMFVNRLQENGGVMTAFRDVTGAVFPAGYSYGNGHYEEEMGDFDNDLDLDVYGLNWQTNNGSFEFTDVVMQNDGAGSYGNVTQLAGSNSDESEGDFIDYDNDGDLDLFVANFSGGELLYENDGAGAFRLTAGELPFDNTTSLDADMTDIDDDADYDLMIANDQHQANLLWKNVTQVPDTHAPLLANLEQPPGRVAGPTPTVVRVQVYDNAAYYFTWYNTTVLEVTVDSCPPYSATIPMESSQGQIFRGEIPGDLVGTVNYRAVSSDRYGNTGSTPWQSYVSTGTNPGTPYCFGDGLDPMVTALCPCGNFGLPGHGCENSNASLGGAHLCAEGTTTPNTVLFTCSGIPNGNLCTFLRGTANDAAGQLFGDGVKCISGTTIRFGQQLSGPAGGNLSNTVEAAAATVVAGNTRYYQLQYRNPAPAFCPPATFNVSNGYTISW